MRGRRRSFTEASRLRLATRLERATLARGGPVLQVFDLSLVEKTVKQIERSIARQVIVFAGRGLVNLRFIMRILLLNQSFAPDSTATAQHLTDLARHLHMAGHQVIVLADRRSYETPRRAAYSARETLGWYRRSPHPNHSVWEAQFCRAIRRWNLISDSVAGKAIFRSSAGCRSELYFTAAIGLPRHLILPSRRRPLGTLANGPKHRCCDRDW